MGVTKWPTQACTIPTRNAGLELDHLRSPPELTRSIRGHLIAYHLLGNIVIGNDAVMTC